MDRFADARNDGREPWRCQVQRASQILDPMGRRVVRRLRIGSSTHHPTLRIKKMFKLDRTDTPAGGEHATVYLVFELSQKTWQLGLLWAGSDKLRRYSIAG